MTNPDAQRENAQDTAGEEREAQQKGVTVEELRASKKANEDTNK